MQAADMVREKQINIRLSEDEARRLDFLTEHYGINPSALFRMLMKREEDSVRRIFGEIDVSPRATPAQLARAMEIGAGLAGGPKTAKKAAKKGPKK